MIKSIKYGSVKNRNGLDASRLQEKLLITRFLSFVHWNSGMSFNKEKEINVFTEIISFGTPWHSRDMQKWWMPILKYFSNQTFYVQLDTVFLFFFVFGKSNTELHIRTPGICSWSHCNYMHSALYCNQINTLWYTLLFLL